MRDVGDSDGSVRPQIGSVRISGFLLSSRDHVAVLCAVRFLREFASKGKKRPGNDGDDNANLCV